MLIAAKLKDRDEVGSSGAGERMRWDEKMGWDGMGWDGMGWDGMG